MKKKKKHNMIQGDSIDLTIYLTTLKEIWAQTGKSATNINSKLIKL